MEQGRKTPLGLHTHHQTRPSCVLFWAQDGTGPPCPPIVAMEEAGLDSMPSWTQPRGQGAAEGGLSLPREAKRASSCILLLLHTQARHIHRQAPLESFRFFPAPASQPSSRPLHLSSASQLLSPTWASHLQCHPSNPFLRQDGVIQCVKSCSFPAQSSFTTSEYP